MLKVIFTHGLLMTCALVIAGTAAAAYLEKGETRSSVPEADAAPLQADDGPSGELNDSERWEAGLDQFDAFATPGTDEYGRAKSFEADPGAPAIVPEPGSMMLLAGGLAALAAHRMRRRTA